MMNVDKLARRETDYEQHYLSDRVRRARRVAARRRTRRIMARITRREVRAVLAELAA